MDLLASFFGRKAFWKVFWKGALPVTLVLLTLIFGTLGFHQYFSRNASSGISGLKPGEQVSWMESFLLAAGLPLIQTTTTLPLEIPKPLLLDVARIIGLAIPPYAFILILMAAFHERFKHLRIFWWRILSRLRISLKLPDFFHIHYAVICGCGWKGAELASSFCEKHSRWKVVVIDQEPDNALLGNVMTTRVVSIIGDVTDPDVLHKAQVGYADRVYILCNSDELNCRVANQLVPLRRISDAGSPFCYVHMDDARRRELLADQLGPEVACFNTCETTARRLLARCPIDRFEPLNKDKDVLNEQKNKTLHSVILGSHPMAKSLLIQLLRIGHFPIKGQLKITWAVPDVELAKRDFFRQHPFLDPNEFKDNAYIRKLRGGKYFPEIEFCELPRSDSQLLADGNFLFDKLKDNITSVYVCIDDGLDSMAYTSSLAAKLHTLIANRYVTGNNASDKKAPVCDIQLFCYFNYPGHKDYSLFDKTREKFKGLTVIDFGNFLDECSVEAVESKELDLLAREVAALYVEIYSSEEVKEKLKAMDEKGKQKYYDLCWKISTESDREANRQAADHIPLKIRSIHPKICVVDSEEVPSAACDKLNKLITDNLPMLSELEHRRWCVQKLLEGWMPLENTDWAQWKANKNAFKSQKLHFDLIPFEELSDGEKGKDTDQIKGIPRFLKNVGKSVNIPSEV